MKKCENVRERKTVRGGVGCIFGHAVPMQGEPGAFVVLG